MDRSPDMERLTQNEAKVKAAKYCAYQERSQKEVRKKLYDLGLWRNEVEETLSELIVEGYINEERFAKSYAGGKFRIKKWGKNRILLALKEHDLSSYCMKKAMEEIPEEEYLQTLEQLISKKEKLEPETNLYKKREKVARSMIYKGYEPDLVWRMIKELIH